MNILIWSKNRSCQLDALLKSLYKYGLYNITILYKASNGRFQDGYNELRSLYPHVSFYEEDSYRENTIYLISGFGPYTCLCTDDMVFFRNPPDTELIKRNLKEDYVFSYRLGYNTVIQDHINGFRQPGLVPERVDDGLLFWQPGYYKGFNYGYPFALDAHVYHTEFILDRIKQVKFNTANELEGVLQRFNRDVGQMFCNTVSSAVNIPANNMSGLTGVNKNSMDLAEMNERFLSGQQLKYIFPIISGCHQDVEFCFETG